MDRHLAQTLATLIPGSLREPPVLKEAPPGLEHGLPLEQVMADSPDASKGTRVDLAIPSGLLPAPQ